MYHCVHVSLSLSLSPPLFPPAPLPTAASSPRKEEGAAPPAVSVLEVHRLDWAKNEKEAVARAAAFERRAGEAEQSVEQLAGDAEQRSVQVAALERRANEAEQARAALDSKVSPRREGV